MINYLKKLISTAAVSALLFTPMLVPATAHAQITEDCGGIAGCLDSGADATDPGNADQDATQRVNDIIKLVINIFSIVVGVVSVIMIIIGGLKYIMSGGEGSNIQGAKNTILYAIIGLVIVALAQVIVQFVLEKATAA